MITRRKLSGFLAVAPVALPPAIREGTECRRSAPAVPFFHVKIVDTTYMPQLAGPDALEAYRRVTGEAA